MRPPFCRICDSPVGDLNKGLVCFKKRHSDIAWDRRVEEEGITGHPPYCDWFCELHVEEARKLSALPIDRAMKQVEGG